MLTNTSRNKKIIIIITAVFAVLSVLIFLSINTMIEEQTLKANCDSVNGMVSNNSCRQADEQLCNEVGGKFQKYVACLGMDKFLEDDNGNTILDEDGYPISADDAPSCVGPGDYDFCYFD